MEIRLPGFASLIIIEILIILAGSWKDVGCMWKMAGIFIMFTSPHDLQWHVFFISFWSFAARLFCSHSLSGTRFFASLCGLSQLFFYGRSFSQCFFLYDRRALRSRKMLPLIGHIKVWLKSLGRRSPCSINFHLNMQ